MVAVVLILAATSCGHSQAQSRDSPTGLLLTHGAHPEKPFPTYLEPNGQDVPPPSTVTSPPPPTVFSGPATTR